MDFLNKAFAQFNDLFRSMTPGGRITAGLLLVVAVVSVGYLFQHQVSGGDDYLFGGESIPTPTLQKMEEAFGKAGLNGFTIEGGRVKVPHAHNGPPTWPPWPTPRPCRRISATRSRRPKTATCSSLRKQREERSSGEGRKKCRW